MKTSLKRVTREKRLDFSVLRRMKLYFSIDLREKMHLLWLRYKHYASRKGTKIGDLYREAFEKFLFENKIPKVIPKVERRLYRMEIDSRTAIMLDDMKKIAAKRNQPLTIVVEEALQSYLDLPENYLGKNLQRPGKVERIG